MSLSLNARIKLARIIAVCADAVQLGLFPLFMEGGMSPFDDALDLLVCITLTILLGWHFSFLPSFIVKIVPVVDLAPTWTIAVFLATRKNSLSPPKIATQVYASSPAQAQFLPSQTADK